MYAIKWLNKYTTLELCTYSYLFCIVIFSLKKKKKVNLNRHFSRRCCYEDWTVSLGLPCVVYWHGIRSRRLVASRRQEGSENLNTLTCSQSGKYTRSPRTKHREEGVILHTAKLVFPQVQHDEFYTRRIKNQTVLWEQNFGSCNNKLLMNILLTIYKAIHLHNTVAYQYSFSILLLDLSAHPLFYWLKIHTL